jgi:3-oxoadipate enol-lactonase
MKLTLPNQQELSYNESGRGSTVVLIHAFPLSRELWTSTIRALSTGYHVLAPDLLGFGDSPLSAPLETSMEAYGDHIIALLEEKKIKKAVFVGCSIGGYILFPLYRRYPSLFRGLVLVDTKAELDPPEAQKARLQNAALFEGPNPPAEFFEGMLARLLGATTQRERPGVVSSVRRMMSQASPNGVAAALRAMAARSDSTSLLSSIHTPTLVLTGEEDQITPPTEAKIMASKIPNGSFVMAPKSGHLPSIEAPEFFQKELLSFLSTLR